MPVLSSMGGGGKYSACTLKKGWRWEVMCLYSQGWVEVGSTVPVLSRMGGGRKYSACTLKKGWRYCSLERHLGAVMSVHLWQDSDDMSDGKSASSS